MKSFNKEYLFDEIVYIILNVVSHLFSYGQCRKKLCKTVLIIINQYETVGLL